MIFRGLCLLSTVLWITFSSSTQEHHQNGVRIKIHPRDMQFRTRRLPSAHNTVLKLVKELGGTNMYAGSPQGLYVFEGHSEQLTPVHVPLFGTNCQDNSSACGYSISLLKEGNNGNPLFICGENEKTKNCCDVNSKHELVNCFTMPYNLQINEPSLHIDDMLFFTLSGESSETSVGLYKCEGAGYIWPLSSRNEQRYVKLLANQGTRSLGGKLYSLYIEKNSKQDSETALWTPRVSQICMADRGGSKQQLQYRWTSMLTARLFCGDEKKRISFTELLDVAVVEAEDWSDSLIYALFKNDYNLSSICVYKMADISRTFTDSPFLEKDMGFDFLSHRPGKCFPDMKFPHNFLKFMESRPEMEHWIKPAHGPMLVGHRHYTHLQVDSIEGGRNVLLIALDSGRVHKVLEQDGKVFTIAEYQPFTSKTHVQSMLLDRSTKQLYVSSSSEVVSLALKTCGVYGAHCCLCVQARDPYCGWSESNSSCSPVDENRHLVQDLNGNCSVCKEEPLKVVLPDKPKKWPAADFITQGCSYHLNCPAISRHATYTWLQGGVRRTECVLTEHGYLLLITSVSKDDGGTYQCMASENGQEVMVMERELVVNAAPRPRATPLVLACFLVLLSMIS